MMKSILTKMADRMRIFPVFSRAAGKIRARIPDKPLERPPSFEGGGEGAVV